MIAATALRFDEPVALVVLETGLGVLAKTPRATADDGNWDGVGEAAAAAGLAEADGVGLDAADASALALALTTTGDAE